MRKAIPAVLIHAIPSFGSIIFCGVFLSVILMGPATFNLDGDTGRHITVGNYILDHHQVPTRDPFSHTLAGAKLTPHEWLSQVLLALAYRAMGMNGIVLWAAVMLAAAVWLIFRQSLARGSLLSLAVVFTIIAAAGSSLHWLARPHLWTLLLMIPWVGLLESLRLGRPRRWWALPIIMLAWANLHGAFVAGFATWLAYFVGALWERFIRRKPESVQAIRWLLLSGGASLAVTLLNPAGVDIWATSLGYVSNRYLVSHTNEYLPPDLLQINYWPFALLLALAIILLMAKRLRMPAAHIFLMLGWAIMGLFSARNVPIFALVSAPILASGYSGLIGQYSSKFAQFDQRLAALDRLKRLFSWPVLVLALVLMLLVRGVPLDANQVGNRYLPEHFPVAAVDAIAGEIPAGHVFNYFPWGGYLLFRLYPDVQVFIDGQTDFYGETLTRQYEQVISLTPGWEAVLAKYQVEWVMMPTGEPLVAALESAPGWQVRYRDQTTTILIHE